MKLHCTDEHIAELCKALAADNVPVLLMERTGNGWHVEYISALTNVEAVTRLIELGIVQPVTTKGTQ
jgi:hypothetical protein